jgi:ABC-2 type transport system ATP-binding protein
MIADMIPPAASPVLAVEGVEKSYGGTPALRGVTFAVAPGELFGLLGPNGAGKTTLISILAGLTDASAGRVTLFGEPFTTRSVAARRLVGLATQDVAVYPELTARENLHFFGRLYGLGGGDLRTRTAEMLELAALTDRADKRAGTFSGGMKRRLNLAVALVHRPRLLILDEPTTGVDPQSRNHIFEQVQRLNAGGLTVVYTSHSMEEVQALCPRLVILDHGHAVACDTVANLLRQLPTTAKIATADAVPDGLPGVTAVRRTAGGVELDAADGPALFHALQRWPGLTMRSMEVVAPTLERVFLKLTGSALRD